jgi:hypothetical protein
MRVSRPRIEGRAPIAVAGLLAVPIFFAALLAASLAYDRPHVVRGRESPPTTATEAAVWGLALVAPAILVVVGLAALPFRRVGVYVSVAAAIVLCVLLPLRLDAWIARHGRRFPLGMDYLKDNDPANTSSRGEWEHAAKETVLSLTHWTIGLAVGAAVVAALVHLRRKPRAPVPPPPEVVGAPSTSLPPVAGDR